MIPVARLERTCENRPCLAPKVRPVKNFRAKATSWIQSPLLLKNRNKYKERTRRSLDKASHPSLDIGYPEQWIRERKFPGVVRRPTEFLFSYGTLQLEAVQSATFGRLLEGTPDAREIENADKYEVPAVKRVAVVLQSGVRAWAYVDARSEAPGSLNTS
jgi:hypothetical protein